VRATTLAAIVACGAVGCGATATTKPLTTAPTPTPTPQTLAVTPLHLGGDPPPAPASVGPPGTVVEARYRVCLGDDGRVRAVTPAPGLAAVDDAAGAALRGWSWFVVTSAPDVCFVVPMQLAVPNASRLLRQATNGVHAHATFTAPPNTPAWLATARAGQLVASSYKVCVGDDGLVQTVRAIAGVPGADDALVAGLRASRWDVVVGTLAQAPYCFAAPVHLDFTRVSAANGDSAVEPPTPFPASAGRAAQPGVSTIVRLRSSTLPASPPRARVCVNGDGSVATVDPPVSALAGVRYTLAGPPGVGFCADAATR